LQPTFTTDPPICLIEGAEGACCGHEVPLHPHLSTYPPLLTPSQNIYHPTKANMRSIKSFSSPSRKHNPFCPLPPFSHQSKCHYKMFLIFYFIISECVKSFITKISFQIVYISESFSYKYQLLLQGRETVSDPSQTWVETRLNRISQERVYI
jgi:hypothetical protein